MDYNNNGHHFWAHRTLAVGWLLLLGICGRQAVYAQLRSDLIESARIEKETNLAPETPPKFERAIVSAQKSIPYKLLTGEWNGFGVGFGNITPGAGFAIGPQYKRNDLLRGNLTLTVAARASVN
jgi:hypothetical protein